MSYVSDRIIKELKNEYDKLKNSNDKHEYLQELRNFIYAESELSHNPVNRVIWVPIEKVVANNYNPNQVATNEMHLLYTSIKHDGYTQPIVTVYDDQQDKYIVVDGFHRYKVGQLYKDIKEANHSMLPIVVIDKGINDMMASTIRHNRARGKHSVTGMSKIVFDMLENGWSDADICQELGMEDEELIRLKHITGFSKLFKDVEYRNAWETDRQISLRKEWERKQEDVEEQ